MINKKHLIGGLNTDDAEVLMDSKEYLGALNIRFVTSENGSVGRITNIEGNIIKNTTLAANGSPTPFVLPAGTNKVIGSIEDKEKGRVIFFVHNSASLVIANVTYKSHGIYCYDSNTDVIYTVLRDHQVEGGLQFDSYVHSVDILGSFLSWTDNKIDPKSINIDAAIKSNHPVYIYDYSYTLPIPYESSTVIKRPPIYALQVQRTTEDYPNNYIKTSSFKFLYQYVYKDGQVSALSAHSALVPFSKSTQTSNCVKITFPISEKIPEDVQYIDVIVKYNDEVIGSIVKTFDRDKDSVLINSHNNGTALVYNFFNDEIGISLDSVQSINSFDSVPLLSKTLTYAKNRLFLANNTVGYDTPKANKITVSTGESQIAITGNANGIVKSIDISIRNRFSTMLGSERFYYVYVQDRIPSVYIYNSYKYSNQLDWPSTLNTADATKILNDEYGLISWITQNYQPTNTNFNWEPQYYYDTNYTYYTTTTKAVVITVAASSIPDQLYFKSGSTYNISISFYDRYRRKCGVVDLNNKVKIPARNISQTSFISSINWSISQDNKLTEIPDWAYYYQIHITKSLVTRFFIQDYSAGFKYAKKTDTGYEYTSLNMFGNTVYAIALDLSRLNAGGRGYSYQEGDLVRILNTSNTVWNLQVIGVDGDKLLVSPIDFGAPNSTDLFYEIYTPYKASASETMYEVGDVYRVINPTSVNRSYSTLNGTIYGDVYATSVTYDSLSYVIEAMNPDKNYWTLWVQNTGWSNVVTKLGKTIKKNSIQFSDTIIVGTKTNGLNSFQSLNDTELPLELNGIQRLVLTNKIQVEGTVMLAIGTNETSSLFLGETQIIDGAGQSFIAKSNNVIGQVNTLRGSYGTVNPESAFSWMGSVYWFDANKGSVIRYDVSGLSAISDNKMRKFFLRIGEYVLKSKVNVLMGIDPFHQEVILHIQKSSFVVSNKWLSDMVMVTRKYAFTTV